MFPKKRAVATHHLLYAFGETLDVKQVQQIIVETFQNLFLNAFECARIAGMDKNRFLEKVEVRGWEHIEAARRTGRGGILIGGHIGNWELAAAYMALRGLPIQVVARRIYLAPLDQKLTEMRERMGVKTLYRDGSMRPMLACLKNNQFLGILPDQDVKRVKGMFVDFFGHPAYTPVGPALIAIASGSPILITRHVRKENGHLIATDPPIYAPRGSRDEEVNRL
jgi:KDO2-lipid IV(A) lauroyltransferase